MWRIVDTTHTVCGSGRSAPAPSNVLWGELVRWRRQSARAARATVGRSPPDVGRHPPRPARRPDLRRPGPAAAGLGDPAGVRRHGAVRQRPLDRPAVAVLRALLGAGGPADGRAGRPAGLRALRTGRVPGHGVGVAALPRGGRRVGGVERGAAADRGRVPEPGRPDLAVPAAGADRGGVRGPPPARDRDRDRRGGGRGLRPAPAVRARRPADELRRRRRPVRPRPAGRQQHRRCPAPAPGRGAVPQRRLAPARRPHRLRRRGRH